MRNKELWYAFLSKKSFDLKENTMTHSNKSIAQQYIPILLPATCYLLPVVLIGEIQ